jgi:hypothetical protein
VKATAANLSRVLVQERLDQTGGQTIGFRTMAQTPELAL